MVFDKILVRNDHDDPEFIHYIAIDCRSGVVDLQFLESLAQSGRSIQFDLHIGYDQCADQNTRSECDELGLM